jgi:tripartite-type tricarboxylate transporter receptor subunit TctC
MFEFIATTIPHVRSGGLRALTVTSAMRWPELPDAPTVGESVPDFEASTLQGSRPPGGRQRMSSRGLTTRSMLYFDEPRMESRIVERGSAPLPGSSAKFTRLIATDSEQWA